MTADQAEVLGRALIEGARLLRTRPEDQLGAAHRTLRPGNPKSPLWERLVRLIHACTKDRLLVRE